MAPRGLQDGPRANPTSPLGREWFREIPFPTPFFPPLGLDGGLPRVGSAPSWPKMAPRGPGEVEIMNPTSPLEREWFREIPFPTPFFPFGEGFTTVPC